MKVKLVVGFEGQYEVEIDKDVAWIVSLNYNRTGVRRRLKFQFKADGYLGVILSLNGEIFNKRVHVLVCEAFYGSRPGKNFQATHRNDVKTDNRPTNLYWATPRENYQDRDRNGRTPKGMKNGATKLLVSQVREIRKIHNAQSLSISQIARKFGVDRKTIYDLLNRKTWKHIT